MGAIIYVSGEGTIFGKKNIGTLKKIKNGWDFPAFEFSKTGCGFEFSKATMEGSNPYEDGVLKPLNSLVAYAKKAGLTVNAEFTITSDWSDYDNIGVIIEDNILSTGNSEIMNTSTEELEAELKKRNKYRYKIKDAKEIIASRNKDDYVKGYIQIDISDMIDNDYEAFLDTISEKLVGSSLLQDIDYDVVGLADESNELILRVSGNVSQIIEMDED